MSHMKIWICSVTFEPRLMGTTGIQNAVGLNIMYCKYAVGYSEES
jgi:hypothetical protein